MSALPDPPETEIRDIGELPPPPRRPAAVAASTALSGYELGEEIGRGGMGVVYRARDRQLDRAVAVKFILAGAFADRDERERFLTEARVTARLHHVAAVLQEERGPFVEAALVERSRVSGVEAIDFQLQQQFFPHTPITLRQ